jgi:glycosyl transferase family 25
VWRAATAYDPGPVSLPIHVINLARATERWVHIRSQLEALGLPFERLEAVDGHTLEPTAPDWPLSPGERGCFANHREAWIRIARGDSPWGIVLEDDMVLHPSFRQVAEGPPTLPAEFDLVKLDTNWLPTVLGRPVGRFGASTLRPLRAVHWAAGAYAITRECGARMAAETEGGPARISVDAFLYLPRDHPWRQGVVSRPPLRIAQAVPAPAIAAHRVTDDVHMASMLAADRRRWKERDTVVPAPGLARVIRRLGRNVARPVRRLARWAVPRARAWWNGCEVTRVPFADGSTLRWRDGRAVRPKLDWREAK